MTPSTVHRLDGIEPDNLLAFLALVGTLRALHASAPDWRPRVSWDIDVPPLRPLLHLARPVDRQAVATAVAEGVSTLAQAYEFEGRADLNLGQSDCRTLLNDSATTATRDDRARADVLAALMHDAAIKNEKERVIDPTPLCLMFGQGHQHFLKRLVDVPKLAEPPPRGRGKQAARITAPDSIAEALFDGWHRGDATASFRWDPDEDVRYATMGGDPTDAAFKTGTQHGANRLAAIGLPVLKLGARARGARTRTVVVGGRRDAGGFSLAWPIWRPPVTLAGVAAMMGHPRLRDSDALAHLGVVAVMVAHRISVGKFMNFTRAAATA